VVRRDEDTLCHCETAEQVDLTLELTRTREMFTAWLGQPDEKGRRHYDKRVLMKNVIGWIDLIPREANARAAAHKY
jgi:hypothetical protein